MEISREQFEEITLDLLDRTRFTCQQALKAAGLDWSDLDRVLLVGGSTRMPMVREMLAQVAGKPPDGSVAADEAVAHGAALHAGWCWPKAPGGRAASPSATSIRTAWAWSASIRRPRRKRNGILIPRNTPLPVTASASSRPRRPISARSWCRSWKARAPRPTTARRSAAARCGISRTNLPAGSPMKVKFHYEANGRLRVRVSGARRRSTDGDRDRP